MGKDRHVEIYSVNRAAETAATQTISPLILSNWADTGAQGLGNWLIKFSFLLVFGLDLLYLIL